ncbi:MAG: hypothetical protein PHF86_01410 [Candidatus Nanoarchaeia archaeon]|nr:hypothetical protein [Candidatus Nanoarchaeia archaeon]
MLKKLKTFFKRNNKKKENIVNQDIINFRYKLIEEYCKRNVDAYTRSIYEEILRNFNNHFSMRGYDIG